MTAATIDERIDKNVLALEILQECGEQTPRYMDSSFFAVMATNFFKTKAREITRNLDVLAMAYNPLDTFNVEREEHGGESTTYGKGNTTATTYGKTATRTDNLTETFDMGTQETTHSVSADNESGYQPRTKEEFSSKLDSTSNTGTQTNVDSGIDSTTSTDSGTDRKTDNRHSSESGRHEAAQGLLLSEFEANKINIYRTIALDFSLYMMISVC